MNKIKCFIKTHMDIISYLFFGVLTTLTNWITYTICVSTFDMSITISNILAWVIAVIFAYITNKIFVFHSKDTSLKGLLSEITMFVSARIVSGLFEIIGVPLLVWCGINHTIFGIDGMVAKAIVSIIVIVLNYIFSKLLVFKK